MNGDVFMLLVTLAFLAIGGLSYGAYLFARQLRAQHLEQRNVRPSVPLDDRL